jgi:hypothetical protein
MLASRSRSAVRMSLLLLCASMAVFVFTVDASARHVVRPRGKCPAAQRHSRHGRHHPPPVCSRRARNRSLPRPVPGQRKSERKTSESVAVLSAPTPLIVGQAVVVDGGSPSTGAPPGDGGSPSEPETSGEETAGAPGGERPEAPSGGEWPETPLGGEGPETLPGGEGPEAPPVGEVPGGGSDSEQEMALVPSANSPFRFFASTSFWNVPLPSNAPLDPSSAAVMNDVDTELQRAKETGVGPKTTIQTTSYSVPLYTVPANQPTVSVALNSATSIPALAQAWAKVPLPPGAQPAAGSDGFLAVWQPSTNKLWEFWRLAQSTNGWSANFGGAMENVSSNAGAYGPEAWSGAKYGWGASSCSLSLLGGLITLEDLERGEINHAVMLSVAKARARVYSSPAQRTDGASSDPLSLPEGAHLRIDPRLDLALLHLPRLTMMIAQAAQRYGMFVCLRGANVAFYGQDPTPTGTNPYKGRSGYFEGRPPEEILASFPWNHVQLLKMELKATY